MAVVGKTNKEKEEGESDKPRGKENGKDKLKYKCICGFSEFMKKGEADRSK